MRSIELAKVAASAEALRLRRMVRRQVMRGVFAAGAVVFTLGVLLMLHVVAFDVLAPAYVTPVVAGSILLGFDLVIAIVLGVIALSDKPDAIEAEAKIVREQALLEMRKATSLLTLAGETAGLILRRPRTVKVQTRGGGARLAAEVAARLLARR